ncbi:MAG: succinyl-diaminopimelate desuccinylase, partial [Rubrobacteraceae bacterium]|nr:succinyl-diaminopimelate desuccinylase [Rubrobacteraceae bacterium]
MRERLLESLLFFLERPSVTGGEKALCDDLEARIGRAPGWEIQRISNNLMVRRREPDPSRQKVVFAGHLDTVPQPEEPIEVRVEGDRVYGRGASDMKAGDAMMLTLLEDFDWESGRFEPQLVFYEREEGPFAENGLEAVFAGSPWVLEADLAIVPEPTTGALEVGCVGTSQVEVTFRGKSSHAARPWQGENAITKAGRFLAALHERPAEEVVVDGLSFYEVLTPTTARGGRAKNIVPDSFWVNVNHRFAPGKDIDDVKRLFDGLLGDEA